MIHERCQTAEYGTLLGVSLVCSNPVEAVVRSCVGPEEDPCPSGLEVSCTKVVVWQAEVWPR